MEPQFVAKAAAILVLEKDDELATQAARSIQQSFPSAEVTSVHDINECKGVIASQDFDIVVLDYKLDADRDISFVHQLKLKDNEPAVLLVSESFDPDILNEVNNLGCQRYLFKHGDWLTHLGTAIRQLLRIRRLEQENQRLVAQLTEAKMFLEDKNRRLDEFSATVAHDIRGPLGGISMKLEYLLERYGPSNDERFKTLMERAFQTSKRLVDIVQAMYAYAKLGSRAAKMGEIDLAVLVQEVIHDMSFDEKLDIQIGLGDLPKVWGNADLLRRVFINLLGNAVKYNDKPSIIINIGTRRIFERTLGRFAEIFVSDNGPGIPEAEHKAVFSMFRSGSNSSNGDSLGVGLSVVQRIVELHFGEVKLESSPSNGTAFLLSLPMDKIEFLE
ncbi:MAG: hybrid sensor histidine kinase/response regulator [Deltaproteobacteria bacterium]|nr:hybrid sensor histidine kinase/response regulator [Deltaproteobacteria bacterium]